MFYDGNSFGKHFQKKRGRPKSSKTEFLESYPDRTSDCHRTKVNSLFASSLIGLLQNASVKDQRTVLGCAINEISSGTAHYPKGWKTFAPEIGRYIDNSDEDERPDILNVIVNARKRKLSWSDIGAHFRTCRLGEREGNPGALSLAIKRTIDEFRKRFPKTSEQEIHECLRDVFHHHSSQ